MTDAYSKEDPTEIFWPSRSQAIELQSHPSVRRSSTSLTWKLVRAVNSQAPPTPVESAALAVWPRNLHFSKPSSSLCTTFWECTGLACQPWRMLKFQKLCSQDFVGFFSGGSTEAGGRFHYVDITMFLNHNKIQPLRSKLCAKFQYLGGHKCH